MNFAKVAMLKNNPTEWAVSIGYIITQAAPTVFAALTLAFSSFRITALEKRISNLENAFCKIGEKVISVLEKANQSEE